MVDAQRKAQIQARKDNAIASLIASSNGDRNAYMTGLERLGYFDEAQKLKKGELDNAKTDSEVKAKNQETQRNAYKYLIQAINAAPDPQTAQALIMGGVAKGAYGMKEAQAFAGTLGKATSPELFQRWKQEGLSTIIEADKLLPKTEFRDAGGNVNVYKTGPFGDVSLTRQDAKTMTPAEIDAKNRGWATINDARKERDRPTWDATNQVWVDRTKQTVTPGVGPNGKPPKAGGQPNESERTAGFLLQRIRDSQRQLARAVNMDPDAAGPGMLQEAVRKWSETAANGLTGEARQQVEAAQLDILDAALTLGTGAAYTREQLEGYRKSYFPQLLDKDATKKDKAARLQNLIRAAETKAGRAAADTAPAADAASPQVLRFDAQGNPVK